MAMRRSAGVRAMPAALRSWRSRRLPAPRGRAGMAAGDPAAWPVDVESMGAAAHRPRRRLVWRGFAIGGLVVAGWLTVLSAQAWADQVSPARAGTAQSGIAQSIGRPAGTVAHPGRSQQPHLARTRSVRGRPDGKSSTRDGLRPERAVGRLRALVSDDAGADETRKARRIGPESVATSRHAGPQDGPAHGDHAHRDHADASRSGRGHRATIGAGAADVDTPSRHIMADGVAVSDSTRVSDSIARATDVAARTLPHAGGLGSAVVGGSGPLHAIDTNADLPAGTGGRMITALDPGRLLATPTRLDGLRLPAHPLPRRVLPDAPAALGGAGAWPPVPAGAPDASSLGVASGSVTAEPDGATSRPDAAEGTRVPGTRTFFGDLAAANSARLVTHAVQRSLAARRAAHFDGASAFDTRRAVDNHTPHPR